MKRILSSIVVASIAILSGSEAFAGSRVIIDQSGSMNAVGAVQQGNSNFIRLLQKKRRNSATIQQSGNNNTAVTGQDGRRNTAATTQVGNGNVCGTAQIGNRNNAKCTQVGNGNVQGIIQIGNGNSANARQVWYRQRLGRDPGQLIFRVSPSVDGLRGARHALPKSHEATFRSDEDVEADAIYSFGRRPGDCRPRDGRCWRR